LPAGASSPGFGAKASTSNHEDTQTQEKAEGAVEFPVHGPVFPFDLAEGMRLVLYSIVHAGLNLRTCVLTSSAFLRVFVPSW
jgi:hypothetical protein